MVIAIISLLSSVVLASLRTAQARSRETAIKTQVNQLRVLLEQEFLDTGSYSALQPDHWAPGFRSCATMTLSGLYATQVRAICTNIVALSFPAPTDFAFKLAVQPASSSQYSAIAWLPNKGTYYCIGSSGRNSETAVSGAATDPGCPRNP